MRKLYPQNLLLIIFSCCSIQLIATDIHFQNGPVTSNLKPFQAGTAVVNVTLLEGTKPIPNARVYISSCSNSNLLDKYTSDGTPIPRYGQQQRRSLISDGNGIVSIVWHKSNGGIDEPLGKHVFYFTYEALVVDSIGVPTGELISLTHPVNVYVCPDDNECENGVNNEVGKSPIDPAKLDVLYFTRGLTKEEMEAHGDRRRLEHTQFDKVKDKDGNLRDRGDTDEYKKELERLNEKINPKADPSPKPSKKDE